jgi:23S rRNA (pseudouridine1915-N3)-methyltransferase
MRLTIFAVGRMKSGPETELVSRYTDRLAKAGKALGLEFDGLTEIPESRAQTAAQRKSEESDKCAALAREASTVLILLDERGKSPSSRQFADKISSWRDNGTARASSPLAGRTATTRPCARAPISSFPSEARPGRTSWPASCWRNSSIGS